MKDAFGESFIKNANFPNLLQQLEQLPARSELQTMLSDFEKTGHVIELSGDAGAGSSYTENVIIDSQFMPVDEGQAAANQHDLDTVKRLIAHEGAHRVGPGVDLNWLLDTGPAQASNHAINNDAINNEGIAFTLEYISDRQIGILMTEARDRSF
jgi:hypothetical protein